MNEVKEKRTQITPFSFINSISLSKKDIFDDETQKQYVPFIVNRGLSFFIDTVMYANQMNMSAHIDKKLQYHFLINTIRPAKRWSKWPKKLQNDDMEIVQKYFGFNDKKATNALSILSKEQIKLLKNELEKGTT
jgi:hypothetical protein